MPMKLIAPYNLLHTLLRASTEVLHFY